MKTNDQLKQELEEIRKKNEILRAQIIKKRSENMQLKKNIENINYNLIHYENKN